MKRNIFKVLFTSFVLLFSVFFIKLSGVSAEDAGGSCSCYYIWSVEGANSTNKLESHFYAEIMFTNSSAETVKNCYFGYVSDNDGSKDIATTSTGACTGKIDVQKTSFNVDYNKIVGGKCSKTACSSAQIYVTKGKIKSEPGVFTTNKNAELLFPNPGQAQDKDIFEKAIEGNINRTENADNAINDIDISAVKPNEAGFKEAEAGDSYCDLIPPRIMEILKKAFLFIQILGIILLVVMSMIEFIKALTASSEDGLKGAIKNTYRRIIIAIAILLLPMIVIWILDIVNANAYETDDAGKRVIGTDGNPLCK